MLLGTQTSRDTVNSETLFNVCCSIQDRARAFLICRLPDLGQGIQHYKDPAAKRLFYLVHNMHAEHNESPIRTRLNADLQSNCTGKLLKVTVGIGVPFGLGWL